MESPESEIIVIAYIQDGWYLVDLRGNVSCEGPYENKADAEHRAEVRAFRISQGWAP